MTFTDGEPEQNPVPAPASAPAAPEAPEAPAAPAAPAAPEAPAEPSAPPSPATLAERVRAVRDAWNWSQEEMAEVLRVDQASVSFWERGKIRPSGSALMALAALLRTTVEALEKGDGFVMPAPPGRGLGPRGFRALPRAVCLPVAEPDRVTIVDLASGGLSAQHPGEAVIDLGSFTKANRRIWMVVE